MSAVEIRRKLATTDAKVSFINCPFPDSVDQRAGRNGFSRPGPSRKREDARALTWTDQGSFRLRMCRERIEAEEETRPAQHERDAHLGLEEQSVPPQE